MQTISGNTELWVLFSSVPTNLFPFLTKESQNKIQTFLSENALNKGFTEESLDFSNARGTTGAFTGTPYHPAKIPYRN